MKANGIYEKGAYANNAVAQSTRVMQQLYNLSIMTNVDNFLLVAIVTRSRACSAAASLVVKQISNASRLPATDPTGFHRSGRPKGRCEKRFTGSRTQARTSDSGLLASECWSGLRAPVCSPPYEIGGDHFDASMSFYTSVVLSKLLLPSRAFLRFASSRVARHVRTWVHVSPWNII